MYVMNIVTHLLYFFDRLLKSLPLSGTDTLLQSALFLSSKAVEESFDELEILDSMSSSVMVRGLLRPEDSLLAPVVLPLDPNSFWVRDLPCDAKLGLLRDSDRLLAILLSTSAMGSRSLPKLLSLELLEKSTGLEVAHEGLV
jgi:hypothetical protein